MIPDSLAPGIVIRALDKTSARESGDEARYWRDASFHTLYSSFRAADRHTHASLTETLNSINNNNNVSLH